jgi:hypothetical protein
VVCAPKLALLTRLTCYHISAVLKEGYICKTIASGNSIVPRTNEDCFCQKMQEPGYGTDHERYEESGIMKLSQIERHPDLNQYHLLPESKKAQNDLERQFSRELCKPWLKESRLKVEVSQSQWNDRVIIGSPQRLGESYFPSLRFKEDSPLYINIKEGVDLLEVVRSSRASGLAQRFDPLEPKERWWVVDFFIDGKDLLAAIDGVGEVPQS